MSSICLRPLSHLVLCACSYLVSVNASFSAFIISVTFALQHPPPPNKEGRERDFQSGGSVTRNGLNVCRSRASVLTVVHSDDTCECVVSTWVVRLYNPNQVARFQLNIWWFVPPCLLIEGRNVFKHPACPFCVSVWLRCSVPLLMVEFFFKTYRRKTFLRVD